jgi:hypothetical protein
MKKETLIDIQLQNIKKNKTIFSFYRKISNYYSKKVFIDKLTEIGIYKGDSSYMLSELELLQTKNLFLTIYEENIDKHIIKSKINKRKTKSSNQEFKKKTSNISVYDTLRNTKRIGKFISIRTK